MKDKLKNLFNSKTLLVVVTVLVILHPIIELDYLAYGFLSSIGVPRLTTVVDFLILPFLVLLTFLLNDKSKKKTLIVFGIYALLFGVYFVLHIKNCKDIFEALYLPLNFVFSVKDEIIYTITMLLPLVYIYVFVLNDIGEGLYKKITISLSCLTSFPIFISDLFVFGRSTYSGYTKANIFSWFSLPFTETGDTKARRYACKFFFEEGNTIGILMMMILPLLYYFMYKEKDQKKRAALGILTFCHSIAMIMLSTRVATFGSILVPAVIFVVYMFLVIIKQEKFKATFAGFLLIMSFVCGMIYPYCPAYWNQKLVSDNMTLLIHNDISTDKKKNLMDGASKWMPYSEEWFNYYIYIFEDNVWLVNTTDKQYYLDFYNYKYDPIFWVNYMFTYDIETRSNGRQFENIFQHYKFDPLKPYEKTMGMGYSTFMWGSILVEQDFVQQMFSYGYLGVFLLMGPWVLALVYLALKVVFGFKKGSWNLFNILVMMSICMGFGCGYISGHTFDELTSSLYIALSMAVVFNRLKIKKSEA